MSKANRKLKKKKKADKWVDQHNKEEGKGERKKWGETKFLGVSVLGEWVVMTQSLELL